MESQRTRAAIPRFQQRIRAGVDGFRPVGMGVGRRTVIGGMCSLCFPLRSTGCKGIG